MDSFKRIIITILLTIVSFVFTKASSFAVWQGYEHLWNYNHRLNRIGDYISQTRNKPNETPFFSSIHTGATGLGKDSAAFLSYYTTVTSADIDFFPGKCSFTISGKGGNYYSTTKYIYLPKNKLKHSKKLIAIINGYDIISNAGANKIQHFYLEISNPEPCNKKDTLLFKIKLSVVLNCTSFECNRFIKEFNYTIQLNYLILNTDNNQVATIINNYDYSLKWTKKQYLSAESYNKSIPISDNFAFIAYQRIAVILDRDHWFVGLSNAIIQSAVANGVCNYKHKAFLKQWMPNMKQKSKESKFSSKQPGWGVMYGTLVAVSLPNAKIESYIRDGCIFWKGGNKRPKTNQCMNFSRINLN